ncbi:MAG TPA: hypothetical protein VI168_19425 [Croceibacterium sp.]
MRGPVVLLAIVSAAALHAGTAHGANGDPAAAPVVEPGYTVARTQWGDPDLRGTWPMQNVNDARIPLVRPEAMGTRAWLTDEEFAERVVAAEVSDAAFSVEIDGDGSAGLAAWLRTSRLGRRSSLVVDPADGRLPPLTPQAQELYAKGRSTWQSGDAVDGVSDLDAFERCITRGFPAVMLLQPYNNGLRVFQAPGYVVLQLETFGTRVIPLGSPGHWPPAVRAWHGDSRGRWDGDTLVIETTNLVSGDSVTTDPLRRAAGPFPGRTNATQPVGPSAKVTERLTSTGPDTIDYRVTYDDPDTFTAPWTVALERTRDDGYAIYEYACHERNTVREAITSARALRQEASDR